MDRPLKRSPDAADLSDPTQAKRLLSNQTQTDDETHSDTDVEMTDAAAASTSSQTDVVCYGALCESRIKFQNRMPDIKQEPWARFISLTVRLAQEGNPGQIMWEASHEKSSMIGILDLVTSKQLEILQNVPGVTSSVVLSSEALQYARKNKISKDLSVNILGPGHLADEAGRLLAENRGYLQHPLHLDRGIPYMNPQYFYTETTRKDLRHLIGPSLESESDRQAARLQQGLQDTLESLDTSVPSIDGPEITIAAHVLVTPLKEHQIQAVKFILGRERRDISESNLQELKILLRTRQTRDRTPSGLGGILADAMGLGKTLTMLTSIASTINAAREFAQLTIREDGLIPTRGTLVVVTSRQVLEVWNSEIKSHFHPETLSVSIFHGERANIPEQICDHDVVLTTYSTLMFDASLKGRQVLQKISWFRVVLDEAHWIRNSSTKQFKAAKSLKAERRWCVSGTPIQNSLEDLLSLLKFLQFSPFSEPKAFEEYIVSPLRTESLDGFGNLKLLLRAICLRRNSSLLDLDPAHCEVVTVSLTTSERDAYQRVQLDCREEFDRIVSLKSNLKKYSVLFTTMLKLRRLCSHGPVAHLFTGQAPAAKKRGKATKLAPPTLDSTCEYCSGDEDMSSLLQDMDICPQCSRPLNLSSGKLEVTATSSQSPSNMSLSPMYLGPECPSPGILSSRSPSPLSPKDPLTALTAQSSKVAAVANNIQQHAGGGKSLVFASWRDTLDALARVFDERSIKYLQIDGRVSTADRESRLAQFQQDPAITVLLLSIQTGAVGLTLTCANRVHFTEPQWNPAVEEQAIARALRMGQTQRVHVIRYITENSVEQNIIALQKKKSRLSKLSLDAAENDGEAGGIYDLKFVLDPDAS